MIVSISSRQETPYGKFAQRLYVWRKKRKALISPLSPCLQPKAGGENLEMACG